MYVKIGGIKVREDKLSAQSMDFAVMIIQLVKQVAREQASARISEKRGMPMERQILYQSSKLRSKKRTKPAIG